MVQIFCIGLFFSQVVYSTKSSYDSFTLNIGQKMLRFWKVTLGNLKIEKLFVILLASNFQEELFVNKFDSIST